MLTAKLHISIAFYLSYPQQLITDQHKWYFLLAYPYLSRQPERRKADHFENHERFGIELKSFITTAVTILSGSIGCGANQNW